MKNPKFLLILLLVLFASNLFAQRVNNRVLLWQARTQSITNDILGQINKSSSSERIYYYAKLGEIWWEKDKKTGKQYLDKAVDYAISPATDYKDISEQNSKLRELLKIASSKDASLEKKILNKLNELSDTENESENGLNSEAILQTAISLVDTDTQRAYNLGVSVLRLKKPVFSFKSIRLFLNIREKNESLANNYYKQALDVAKTNTSADFVDKLYRLAFPKVYEFNPVSDESLRKAFLDILSNYIQIESQNVLEKKSANCDYTRYYGIESLNKYKQLLPEKVIIIEKAINICQVSDDVKNKDDLLPEKPAKTIEDFLELARTADDKSLHNKYLLEAALLANQQKKFKFAIEILDQIDEESRNIPPGVWDMERIETTASFVGELIENNYLAEVSETINKSPKNLRPEIRISVADKLDVKKNKLLGYELLNDSLPEFAKADFKFTKGVLIFINSPISYKYLTDLYLTFDYQNDAMETFDTGVKSLNRYVAAASDEDKPLVRRSLNWAIFANFPDKFADVYFQRIEQNIAEIEYVPIKLDVQLQWLKNTLKKQVEIEKEFAVKSAKSEVKK